jgi:hypothetical protein
VNESDAIEQKARELLAAEYERTGFMHHAAIRVIVAALQAQQPPSAEALGYVRREALRRLREDPEVTGVMVHDDPPTDSVPVYLDPPAPLAVSDADAIAACKVNLHSLAEPSSTEIRHMRAALESFVARKST